MNSFINIQKDFKPELNFWELNPHLIYVKPFANLYSNDKSKDKTDSSNDMWCILWMAEPDDEVNKYYRIPEDERVGICKEFNSNFDINSQTIIDCINAYPEVCLTPIERSYKTAKDFLSKREKFLKEAEYSFETMTALENAVSKTPKVLEDFAKVEQQYLQTKNKATKIFGGRQQTLREKKQILPDE